MATTPQGSDVTIVGTRIDIASEFMLHAEGDDDPRPAVVEALMIGLLIAEGDPDVAHAMAVDYLQHLEETGDVMRVQLACWIVMGSPSNGGAEGSLGRVLDAMWNVRMELERMSIELADESPN